MISMLAAFMTMLIRFCGTSGELPVATNTTSGASCFIIASSTVVARRTSTPYLAS